MTKYKIIFKISSGFRCTRNSYTLRASVSPWAAFYDAFEMLRKALISVFVREVYIDLWTC